MGGSDMLSPYMDFPSSSHGLPSSKQVKSVWLDKASGVREGPQDALEQSVGRCCLNGV